MLFFRKTAAKVLKKNDIRKRTRKIIFHKNAFLFAQSKKMFYLCDGFSNLIRLKIKINIKKRYKNE